MYHVTVVLKGMGVCNSNLITFGALGWGYGMESHILMTKVKCSKIIKYKNK